MFVYVSNWREPGSLGPMSNPPVCQAQGPSWTSGSQLYSAWQWFFGVFFSASLWLKEQANTVHLSVWRISANVISSIFGWLFLSNVNCFLYSCHDCISWLHLCQRLATGHQYPSIMYIHQYPSINIHPSISNPTNQCSVSRFVDVSMVGWLRYELVTLKIPEFVGPGGWS